MAPASSPLPGACRRGPKTANALDGCVGNVAAPWATWNTNKVQKILPADVAAIAKASVSIKATTFGSCNFIGDPTSHNTSGGGKFQFYDITGTIKIKGGGGSFYAHVVGDLPTFSVMARGIVTNQEAAEQTPRCFDRLSMSATSPRFHYTFPLALSLSKGARSVFLAIC